ncbi:ABC transporter permease [Ruminococcus sp.]|uniref:ABC transporter permease n=1 Tax=Ruminococcus sp. TaxID=41978 RepID=UPI001B025238|nr:ABC transporter permease [Ruminococcus sp.]MBO5559095.1 ABC transporter permease [Ruminococcus sp.]
MDNASFISQTRVYFNKIRRIAFKEKFWKFIIFALIISFIVAAVVGEDMFTTYESTKSGFFSMASAAIWIGIFNSIQNICKEHEIIRAEYRTGMKLSSYITANVLWQFIICLIQSCIILSVSLIFIDYNDNGIIIGSAVIEYFITILLMTFGADIMGIMISSISGSPTTAMTIMPFVLILQLIMSGVLFDLSGWSEKISYITFSKWGMSAFGSIADLNSDDFPLRLSEAFPQVVKLETEDCYDHTTVNLLTAWGWCVGISVFCYAVSILSLKIRNRDS